MISNPGSVKYSLIFFFYFYFALIAHADPIAGHFQFVHGQVRLERAGQQLVAERSMPVHTDDVIHTQAASSAQIRMIDGALVALRPRSELAIESYAFNRQTDDNTTLNLARGSLRTVTGTIGRQQPENVQIHTPVATMGIRGTDMDTFVTPASSSTPAQAFLRVNSGEGTIRSAQILLHVPAGNIAQVIAGQPPRLIPELPLEIQAQEEELTQTLSSEDEEASRDDEVAPTDDMLITTEEEQGLLFTDTSAILRPEPEPGPEPGPEPEPEPEPIPDPEPVLPEPDPNSATLRVIIQ